MPARRHPGVPALIGRPTSEAGPNWSEDQPLKGPAKGARHASIVAVSGRLADGTKRRREAAAFAPKGQSHVTAIGVVASLERIVGQEGPRLRPGVAVPETHANPARLLKSFQPKGMLVSVIQSGEPGRVKPATPNLSLHCSFNGRHLGDTLRRP